MNKVAIKKEEFIPCEKSHLYGIKSTHLLAKKLGVLVKDLERFANKSVYRVFNLKDSGRRVEEPPPALQAIHRKIHRYLARIEAPTYLHSAIKGRSYISNATAHIGIAPMIKIDVKKFFPSVPQHKVMHFFRDHMQCASDVAGLLANLTCRNGRLPTGGAASPILSYYSFKSMFDEKFFDATRPKIVTGVMVKGNRLELPHSRWRAIRFAEKELVKAATDDQRLALYPALISRLHEAAQIDPACRSMALYHNQKWKELRQASVA